MIKDVIHVYFGDYKGHPIILNYIDNFEIRTSVLDSPKATGSRSKRISSLLSKMRSLERSQIRVLHTHDILSFYLSRFLFPLKRVIFDSHEVYSSYFKFPLNLIVCILEEIATLLSSVKIFPSAERRELYFIKRNTVIIENLFLPNRNPSRSRDKRDLNSFVYAGLLSRQRCIAELIDMFRNLPQCTLTIYGIKNDYMAKIIEKGLPANVKYAGSVAHTDLIKLLPKYAASFALYFPSDLNNKFPAPTKIFENEYFGLATIVLSSRYLRRLDREKTIINTLFIDKINSSSLNEIINSGRLGKCQPNKSPRILWESQKAVINGLYSE